MAVTLTEAAARHVSRYIARRGKGVGVRVGAAYDWTRDVDGRPARVHGWYYDILTGAIEAYDPNLRRFIPLEDIHEPDLE